ncbi:hypothetical protein L2E82_20148 [Cichorium intybus]|uniref:Uncharacterized protein n=1 Tax=Cichorium intybus TaxID=13427 RepID=A0ACB9DS75_CICIN|nr:hypothetical protein L2E82_20148 [Cichorium intybus]
MANPTTTSRTTTYPASKRRRLSDDNHHSLLPGLPDHIAHLCLSLVSQATLYSVCRSWRRLIYSGSIPPFRSIYTLSLPTTAAACRGGDRHNQMLRLSSFDPISSKWITIDSPSLLPFLHRLSVRHPSFTSRNLPVQSLSVSGNLVLLAATSSDLLPALPHPLVFNPVSNSWSSGPPLSTPRRWCAAGSLQGTVIVASGIGSHYTQTVARSVEKWVLRNTESSDRKRGDSDGVWEKMRSLRNAKLCRESIDAVGWRGKLCMVNVKGDYAKEGFVYHVDSDKWVAMPEGMLGGWRGPATAMDEETMYVVDESRGILKRYNDDGDDWSEVMEDERLKGAEYIAAGGGKVCVACEKDVRILVVDVVATPPRLWVVETPAGHEILALHILPRMSLMEF